MKYKKLPPKPDSNMVKDLFPYVIMLDKNDVDKLFYGYKVRPELVTWCNKEIGLPYKFGERSWAASTGSKKYMAFTHKEDALKFKIVWG